MVALDARNEVRKRDAKRDQSLAYNTAALAGVAFAGKLRSFDNYFREHVPNSDLALLGSLRKLKARGVGMKIERLQRSRGGASVS